MAVDSLGQAMTSHMPTLALANALTHEQIEIANHFHRQLPRWRSTDKALFRLRDRLPEWDAEACILKSVAINSLYRTNVYAIIPMAEHIASIFAGPVADSGRGEELVERIARLPNAGSVPRNFISFG